MFLHSSDLCRLVLFTCGFELGKGGTVGRRSMTAKRAKEKLPIQICQHKKFDFEIRHPTKSRFAGQRFC